MYQLTLDNSPPLVSLNANPESATNSSVSVVAQAYDTGIWRSTRFNYKWSLDGGLTWSGYGTNSTQNVVANAMVKCQVIDESNYQSAITSLVVSNIDKLSPSVSLSSTLTAWTNGSVVVSATAADTGGSGLAASAYRWSLDGGSTWSAYGTNTTQILTANATVKCQVKDAVGNESLFASLVVSNIDNTIPTLYLDSSHSNWTRTSVKLQATAVDTGGSGLAAAPYRWSVDGGVTWGNWVTLSSTDVTNNGIVKCQVKDLAGNLSEVVSWTVNKIDISEPQINLSSGKWASTWLTGTANATDYQPQGGIGSGLDLSTWLYALDTDIFKPLTVTNGRWELDISQISVGTHSLKVSISDNLGNQGVSLPISFTVDRTPPVVSDVRLYQTMEDQLELISQGELASSTQISLQTITTDVGGEIDRIQFRISQYPLESSLLKDSQGNPLGVWTTAYIKDNLGTLDGTVYLTVQNGVNYIYVLVKDDAGNWSVPTLRQVLVDTSIPTEYQLVGLTHPELKDSLGTALSDAVFAMQVGAGQKIQSYEWQLWAVQAGQNLLTDLLRTGELEGSEGAQLLLDDLADNRASENYLLRARGKGVNQKYGAWVEYSFRIDTTPPKNLTINSWSHGNEVLVYPTKRASVWWSEPQDLSGVRSYYYRWSVEKWSLPTTDEELRLVDLGPEEGWTGITQTEITGNLGSDSPDSGVAYLTVCAEDYVGNRQFDQREFRWDTVKPTLKTDGPGGKVLDLRVEQLPLNGFGSLKANFGSATDDQELNRVLLKLSKWNGLRFESVGRDQVYRNGHAGSYTWTDLPGEVPLLVEIEAIDSAGNRSSKQALAQLNGDEIPVESLSMPFEFSFLGYRMEGEKRVDGSLIKADVTLPSGIQLLNGNQNVSKLALDPASFVWDSQGNFVSAVEVPDAPERILVTAGFRGTVSVIGVNSLRGLTAGNLQLVMGGRSFNYKVELNAPPQEGFASSTVLTAEPPVSLNTLRKDETGHSRSAWPLVTFTSSSLEDRYWKLSTGGISTQGLYEERGWDFYWGSSHNRIIPVHTALVQYDAKLYRAYPGVATNDIWLEIKGCQYKIIQFYWNEDRLVVVKAQLQLGEGYSPSLVEVRNFSLGLDGKIRPERGFSVDGFRYKGEDGLEYDLTGFQMDDQGNLFADGQGTVGTGTLELEDLRLTSSGPDWTLGAKTADRELNIHGFTVSAQQIQLKAGGVLDIGLAKIDQFPMNFGGGSPILDGLEYRLSDGVVVNPGKSVSVFTIKTDQAYGGNLSADGLSLNSEGFYAKSVTVTNPAGWTGAVRVRDLALKPNGTLGTSQVEEFPQELKILGFDTTVTGLQFDTDRMIASGVTLNLGDAFEPGILLMSTLVWNQKGVITESRGTASVSYTYGGWAFQLPELILDSSGVHGIGTVNLPSAIGGREVNFSDFRLTPTVGGLIHSTGEPTGEVYVNIHGWVTRLQQVIFNPNDLTASTAEVKLYSVMGNGWLEMTDLVLSMTGEVLNCTAGSQAVDFRSVNGFEVKAQNYIFDSEELKLGGLVYLPEGLGKIAVSYPSKSMTLNSDGTIVSEVQSRSISYKFGILNITGSNYWLDREGIYFSQNVVRLQNFSFALPVGKLGYFADGSILFDEDNFQGFETEMFGCHFFITGVSLEKEGLAIRSFIALPEIFKGTTVYFDPLIFHADGRITSETAIPAVNFELGEISGEFLNLRFSGDAFTMSKATLTLPPALENKQISISRVRITSQGDFEIGSISVDPFELFGYTFYLDDLDFSQGVIGFIGRVRLPDSLPAGLGGRIVSIKDFRINTSGEVLGFELEMEGTFDFPLAEGWIAHASGIGVRKDATSGHYLIVVNQGILDFPSHILPAGAQIGSASINGLTFNPVTGDVDFGSISINEVKFHAWGIAFVFNQVSVSQALDFSFRGSATLPQDSIIPVALRGKQLVLAKFEIDHTGALGNVEASLSGVTGDIFPGISLENGTVSLIKTQDVRVGVSGMLKTGANFPKGLSNLTLTIEPNGFEVNCTTKVIEKLNAGVSGLNVNLFGAFDVKDGAFSVKKAEGNFIVEFGGTIQLPTQLPGILSGQSMTIGTCRMNTSGTLEEFSASLLLDGENSLFPGVTLKSGLVTAQTITTPSGSKDYQFSLGGTLKLGSLFPTGIAGTEIVIPNTPGKEGLVFTTGGGVRTADINAQFPDINIMGYLPIRGGSLSLGKMSPESSTLIFGLSGQILLPSGFPTGLAGKPVTINTFKMDTNGTLTDLKIETTGLSANIFNLVTLQNGSLSVTKVNNNEVLFSTTGDLILPEKLPDGLKGKILSINPLKVSSTRGLLAFNAGLASESIEFKVFEGVHAQFNKINLSSSEFSLAGSLHFSDNFPLSIKRIDQMSLTMGWDGTLKDIQANLPIGNFDLAGFKVELKNLFFQKTGISIESLKVSLPSPLNNYPFELRNAGFNSNGTFYGTAVAPSIETDLVGFKLKLVSPSLDVGSQKLTFTRAVLVTPTMMGNAEVALNGVTVGPSGVSLSGAQFSIPDFTAGPGLGFRNMKANFIFRQGTYQIDATGECLVPGVGTFSAQVAFVNQSAIYPIGLKRAYMTYTLTGLGLPIMTTGMYLNQIRGGLAFGPPDELPASVRHLFSNGTRLELGVGIIDGATAGATIKADATLWLDITNVGFAFKGNVMILSGLASGELIAALTKQGFYGSVRVEVVVARGMVEIWVYGKNGKTLIAGNGWLQFGLRQGSIASWRVDLPWWLGGGSYGVYIPPGDWWSGSINAQFGNFKNGTNGIKGWITDVPMFGTVGVFVPYGGGLQFVNVGDYVLDTPSAPSTAQGVFAQRSSRNTVSRSLDRTMGQTPIVGSLSATGVSKFRTSEIRMRNTGSMQRTGSSSSLSFNRSVTSQQFSEPGLERLLFVLGIPEGDPVLTAVSPSGKRFTVGSPGVETSYQEFGVVFAVKYPEPGEWTIELTNVTDPDVYTVGIMGVLSAPEVSVKTPAQQQLPTTNEIMVTGTTRWSAGLPVTVYASKERESYVGESVGTGVVASDGSFQVKTNTSTLSPGEYFLYAGVGGIDDPEKQAYAPGSVVVGNSNRVLQAVSGIKTAVSGDDGFELWFDNPNGDLSSGIRLHIEQEGAANQKLDLGVVEYIRLGGFKAGKQLRLTIVPYDAQGNEGPVARTEVLIGTGTAKYTLNWESQPAELVIKAGETWNGRLSLKAVGSTSDQSVKVSAGLTGLDEEAIKAAIETGENPLDLVRGLYALTEAEPISLGVTGVEVPLKITSSTSLAVGDYNILVKAVSTVDNRIAAEIVIPVKVVYPAPRIEAVVPNQWKKGETPEVTLYGQNFLPGTRILIGTQELVISTREVTLLRFTPHSAIEGGETVLKVLGPDGQSSEISLNILEPAAILNGELTLVQTGPGMPAKLFARVEGIHGFDKKLSLRLMGLPEGWMGTLTKDVIGPGETTEIVVTPGIQSPDGDTSVTLTSDMGHELALKVQVRSGVIAPVITNLSTFAGFPGDLISVYGYGFGSQKGRLMLGALEMNISTWSPTEVKAWIPSGIIKGKFKLSAGDQFADGPDFYVKTIAFDLKPEVSEVRMSGMDVRQVSVQIMGYADRVDLTAEEGTGALQVSWGKTWIKPNGGTQVKIVVPAGTPNGIYSILLTGRSGLVAVQKYLTVRVGDAFAVTTKDLPQALVDAPYTAKLNSGNGQAPVYWTLKSGNLPLGLTLTRDGMIRGIPKREESINFTVEAEEAFGRKAIMNLTMKISLNLWKQEGMDRGQTRYNPVSVPGNDVKKWVSPEVTGAVGLWTARNRVIVRGDQGISLINSSNGMLTGLVEGQFGKGQTEGENLVLLDNSGVLKVVDSQFGGLKWERTPVRDYVILGRGLVVYSDQTLILDVETGELKETLDWDYDPTDKILEAGDRLYRLRANTLEFRTETGWNAIITGEGPLRDAAIDSHGLVVLGDRKMWVQDETELKRIDTEWEGDQHLALSPDKIYVIQRTQSALMHRRTLVKPQIWDQGGTHPVVGEAKVFSTGERLVVWNPVGANEVWSAPGYKTAVLSAGTIFALDTQGKVTAFSGPSNAWAPVTTGSLGPETPNGLNGWYKTSPTLSLSAKDRDGRVSVTRYRIDDQEWNDYSQVVTLPMGVHRITYFSIDDGGWEEPYQTLDYRADKYAPEVSWTASGVEGLDGWFTSAVTLTGTAADEQSGIAQQTWKLNDQPAQTYSEPVILGTSGLWNTRYEAVDNAGLSSGASLKLKIDLEDPLGQIKVQSGLGYNVITLEASDSISGIAKSLIRVDGGDWTTYQSPLWIVQPGNHKVDCQVWDSAGRTTGVISRTVQVQDPKSVSWIRNLEFTQWRPFRQVVRNMQGGELLYAGDRQSKMPALPGILKGSDYIQLHQSDRDTPRNREFVSFVAGVDLEVYVARDLRANNRNVEGFELVAGIKIGDRPLWKKVVLEGETVSIGAPDSDRHGGPDWILAQYVPRFQLKIATPEFKQQYYPGQSMTLQALGLKASGTGPHWSLHWSDGTATDAGTGWAQSIMAPWTEAVMEGTVEATNEGLKRTVDIKVVNLASFSIHLPRNRVLPAGGTWDLEPKILGVDGSPLSPESIRWTARNLIWGNVVDLEVADGVLKVPQATGLWNLKVTVDLGGGHMRSYSALVVTLKSIPQVTIDLGERGEYWKRQGLRDWTAQLGRGKYRMTVNLVLPWRENRNPAIEVDGKIISLTKDRQGKWFTDFISHGNVRIRSNNDVHTISVESVGE